MKYIISHLAKPTRVPATGTSFPIDYLITDTTRQGYTDNHGQHFDQKKVASMIKNGDIIEVKKTIYWEGHDFRVTINSDLEIKYPKKRIGFFFQDFTKMKLD